MSMMAFVIVFKFMDFGNWKEAANSCVAIFVLTILVVMPIILFVFFTKNKFQLYFKYFEMKFNTLYENTRNFGENQFYFVILFLLRRLVFSFTV
jgi:hypothetical protein